MNINHQKATVIPITVRIYHFSVRMHTQSFIWTCKQATKAIIAQWAKQRLQMAIN